MILLAVFTNVTFHIPATNLTLPLPDTLVAWVITHGVLLWFGMRFAIKWLAKYAGKYKFADTALWLLEHVSINKSVTSLADRAALRGPPPDSTAATEGVPKEPTPNGLPTEQPKETNIRS